MSALNEVVEYMKHKVGKTHVDHPNANSGAVLLKLYDRWDEDMELITYKVLQIIQSHFTRDTTDSPVGTAALTNLSAKIGSFIHRFMNRDPIPWNMEIRLGDLFVEAFYNCGFVELYYPQIRDSSHIVSASSRWEELTDLPEILTKTNLQATSLDKPEDVSGMLQPPGVLIKGKLETDKIDIDAQWVRAINRLQQTGWRINDRVYKAFKDYSFVCDIQEEDEDLEKKRLSKKVEESFIKRKAKVLKDVDVFYQYLDVDYRGRFYYIEPFLNFQGSDLARGIMEFAKAKPMTESGLQWLAIHTACSYNESFSKDEIPDWCEEDYAAYLEEEGLEDISVDKMTLSDRINWTNNNMGRIRKWGETLSFQEDAEKMVSLLACCIEWVEYHASVKRNQLHMTRLPIPIDGSNNGWQHLGAISKDPETGVLVGLIPVDIPKDFYVQTAKELKKLATDERLSEILTEMPMKKIRKGISKRGSMTRAYSAGASKIADNMFSDCKSAGYHTDYGITLDDCKKLAKLLVKAISTVCPGPLTTMGYLQKLAAFEIGKFEKYGPDGNPVGPEYKELLTRQKELYVKKDKTDEELEELSDLTNQLSAYESRLVEGNGSKEITWTTPSGFHVVYENFQMATRKTRGTISGYTTYNKQGVINHCAQVATDRPDVKGFMSGISPNFIHSMDASHMARVIDAWSGEFGAVHDSFSCHASDVEKLLAHTKQEFIEMYDVENFYDYIEDELITDKTNLTVTKLTPGSLDIQLVEPSDNFFS